MGAWAVAEDVRLRRHGMSAHGRWLADYSRTTAEVWCSNSACDNHTGPTGVTVESEYGASWATPEECPRCAGEWLYEAPTDLDEWGNR